MVFRVTIAIEWMVWKKPLVPIGLSTIGPNVFLVWQPLGSMVFGLATIGLGGFSMVANHWSNNGMVTIHRYGLFAPFIQPEVVVSKTLGCKNEWKPSKESYSHHKVVVNGPSLWVSFPVEVAGHNIWQGPSKLLMVMAIKFWPPWQGPPKLPWAAGNVREVNLDCSQWSISQDGVLVLYYL